MAGLSLARVVLFPFFRLPKLVLGQLRHTLAATRNFGNPGVARKQNSCCFNVASQTRSVSMNYGNVKQCHPANLTQSPAWSQLLQPSVCTHAPTNAQTHTNVYTPVEAGEGRTAHNNGWNGVNGMASNHGTHVLDVFDTIPLQPLPQTMFPYMFCCCVN
jgi:hypothetical protein